MVAYWTVAFVTFAAWLYVAGREDQFAGEPPLVVFFEVVGYAVFAAIWPVTFALAAYKAGAKRGR